MTCNILLVSTDTKKSHLAPFVRRRCGMLSDLWMSTLQEVSCFEVDMFRTFTKITKVSLAFTFSGRIILHGYPTFLFTVLCGSHKEVSLSA